MKLISTSGVIASKNNCPTAGQFLYSTCQGGVQVQDAGGTWHEVSVPAQAFTDGNCGVSISSSGTPVYGQCGFPPNGWYTYYQASTLTVDPIYWSHPNNPQAGQLAYAGGVFTYYYSFTYYTSYPDTYSGGYQTPDGQILTEVTGIDGWRLVITYQQWNNGYSAVEDDLTPEGMPDPNPTP